MNQITSLEVLSLSEKNEALQKDLKSAKEMCNKKKVEYKKKEAEQKKRSRVQRTGRTAQ